MSNNNQYEVLSPWAEADLVPLKGISPRLTSLEGKKIGIFQNFKQASKQMAVTIGEKLKERYPGIETSLFDSTDQNVTVIDTDKKAEFVEWAKGIDAGIFLVGNWSTCAKYLVYNTIAAEEMGKPSVAVTNQTYLVEEGSAASGRGMPGVRVVWDSIHSEEWVDERDSPERVEAGITPLLDNIIDALTMPLTDEEKSPKQKEPEKPSRILFRGDLHEVNQFFYRRGWGDGLPVIPPTEAAVAEMLTGTDLPPDHVVARMGPRLGKATVEKIAVNAVMAGALPTHLPVIIAGVQALPERATRWDNYQDSQGSWVPFWIINGPVRNDILVNCGVGIFSPGDIANAAIGRAMGLTVKNIGGVRKGIEDAGSFGNPGKYTMVIGEWEEESPWEPFHVERGFKKEDSTLSVLFPNMFRWTIPMGVGAEGILDPIAMNMRAYGMSIIVIPPGTAKFLSEEGFTKQKTKEYIAEHAPPMAPFRLQSSDDSQELPPMPPPGSSTDHMTILVAGGPGGAYIASGAWIQWQEYVTKKIELPRAWDKLVAKYKNLAPVYAKY